MKDVGLVWVLQGWIELVVQPATRRL